MSCGDTELYLLVAGGGSGMVSYSFLLGGGRLAEAGVLSVTGDSSKVALAGSGFWWVAAGWTLDQNEINNKQKS